MTTPALSGWLPLLLTGVSLGTVGPAQFRGEPPRREQGVEQPAVVWVVEAAQIDAGTLERGLRTRVPELDGWSVTVRAGEDPAGHPDRYYVVIRRPDGSRDARDLPVAGDDPQARGRALASELALIIGQWEPPTPLEDTSSDQGTSADEEDVPPPPAQSSSKPMRPGFVLGGGALWLGRSGVPAPGLFLGGGGLVLDAHLMLRGDVSWHVASSDSLALHGVRVAPGVGGGAPLLEDRLWVGGLLSPGLDVVIATDAGSQTLLGFGGAITALAQGRFGRERRLVLEVQTGADLRFPPLRVRGRNTTLRWRPGSWTASVALGVAL